MTTLYKNIYVGATTFEVPVGANCNRDENPCMWLDEKIDAEGRERIACYAFDKPLGLQITNQRVRKCKECRLARPEIKPQPMSRWESNLRAQDVLSLQHELAQNSNCYLRGYEHITLIEAMSIINGNVVLVEEITDDSPQY